MATFFVTIVEAAQVVVTISGTVGSNIVFDNTGKLIDLTGQPFKAIFELEDTNALVQSTSTCGPPLYPSPEVPCSSAFFAVGLPNTSTATLQIGQFSFKFGASGLTGVSQVTASRSVPPPSTFRGQTTQAPAALFFEFVDGTVPGDFFIQLNLAPGTMPATDYSWETPFSSSTFVPDANGVPTQGWAIICGPPAPTSNVACTQDINATLIPSRLTVSRQVAGDTGVEFAGPDVKESNLRLRDSSSQPKITKSVVLFCAGNSLQISVDMSQYLSPRSLKAPLAWAMSANAPRVPVTVRPRNSEGQARSGFLAENSSSIFNVPCPAGSLGQMDLGNLLYVTATSEIDQNLSDNIVMIVLPDTSLAAFEQWYRDESADAKWLAELPCVYPKLGPNNTDPEPSAPGEWQDITAANNGARLSGAIWPNHYHEGASRLRKSGRVAEAAP